MRTQHTPIHSHNSKTQLKHAENQLRALKKITRSQAYRILVDFCPIFDHSLTKTHKLTQSESKCYTQKKKYHTLALLEKLHDRKTKDLNQVKIKQNQTKAYLVCKELG